MLSVPAIGDAKHAIAQAIFPESSIGGVVVAPFLRTVTIGTYRSSAPSQLSSFDEEYEKWKLTHNMSAFRLEEDADIFAAVAAGDCDYANGAIFQYGRLHLPGAINYSDAQVIAYGETVDTLVNACRRDKSANSIKIK